VDRCKLTSRGSQGSHSVTGAVFAEGDLRITTIDEFPVNVAPSRHMLFTPSPGHARHHWSARLPAGRAQTSTSPRLQVGRRIVRGDAVMVLSIDDPIPPSLLAHIHTINGIQEAHPVTL